MYVFITDYLYNIARNNYFKNDNFTKVALNVPVEYQFYIQNGVIIKITPISKAPTCALFFYSQYKSKFVNKIFLRVEEKTSLATYLKSFIAELPGSQVTQNAK